MTKSKIKYEENKELLDSYIINHPWLKEFIHVFTEMQEASMEQRNTSITISVGEKAEEGFLSYLKSSVKNPRMLFTSWNEDNQSIPQIIISDRGYTVTCFSLDNVKIISSKIETGDCKCPFEKYNFVVHIGKFDYDMTMIVYRE